MLDEQQVAIQDMARGFAAEQLAPFSKQWDEEKHFPVAISLFERSMLLFSRSLSFINASASSRCARFSFGPIFYCDGFVVSSDIFLGSFEA